MAKSPESHTLACLRRKLDQVAHDIAELKQDHASIDQRLTTDQRLLDITSEQVAALGHRFERMDQRLERIETRLGLIKA